MESGAARGARSSPRTSRICHPKPPLCPTSGTMTTLPFSVAPGALFPALLPASMPKTALESSPAHGLSAQPILSPPRPRLPAPHSRSKTVRSSALKRCKSESWERPAVARRVPASHRACAVRQPQNDAVGFSGSLEDGPCRKGRLALARCAVHLPSRCQPRCGAAAPRTTKSVRPPQPLEILRTASLRTEPVVELPKRTRVVHSSDRMRPILAHHYILYQLERTGYPTSD